jgi:hypothetical protein
LGAENADAKFDAAFVDVIDLYTVSDKGETALVGPPLDLPWRRIVM